MDTDRTVTGCADQPHGDTSAPPLWTLRAVYTGAHGVVKAEAKPLRAQASLTIGRGTSTIGRGRRLFLEDARVSREHARAHLEGTRAVIEDLGSKNGTQVNGRSLRPCEPCALADGDVLRCGDSFLIVRHEAGMVADASLPSLVGVSQAARKLRNAAARCATTEAPVLLLGEPGTGKEVLAHAIHALSRRSGKLVAVNCAAVPETLAESLFFGTHKAAYTGASERGGFFAEAQHGTLLLDEVGDLPPAIQPKLLRVIETRQSMPLGSVRPVPCALRILAATNRDLEAAMRLGAFRQDLYDRLAGEVIRLPPLRQRREDILLLALHLAGEGFRPSPRLVAAMLRHHWPGNVREVGNLVGRLSPGGEEEVVRWLELQPTAEAPQRALAGGPLASDPAPQLALLAKQTLPRSWRKGDPVPTRDEVIGLLEQHQGSLRRIEKLYGYTRLQFRRWAERYGVDLSHYRKSAE